MFEPTPDHELIASLVLLSRSAAQAHRTLTRHVDLDGCPKMVHSTELKHLETVEEYAVTAALRVSRETQE